MSKHDKDKEHEGFLDRLEDRVEAVGKAIVGRFDEADEDEQTHHISVPREGAERLDIHIHLNVNCCQPGGSSTQAGGGGATNGGKRPGPHPSPPSSDWPPVDRDPSSVFPTLVGGLAQAGRTGGSWYGGRKDNYQPYLFMRANAGDTGTRPVSGAFWESPDIFIAPGVAPAAAPALPPTLGEVARAGVDNTIYAHVWNLGLAPAYDVYVEFYWFNPTLGFNGASAHAIGQTWVDLGERGSGHSHTVVKCPQPWRASYVNGGHECLVVRVSQSLTDPLGTPEWDASLNRHLGQRNIHVMSAAEAAAKPTIGLEVGPLFGAAGLVRVQRTDPAAVRWLHLHTMDRNRTFANAGGNGQVGLTTPTLLGAAIPNLGAVPNPQAAGLLAGQQAVTGDNQQVAFHTNDAPPATGAANVYRVHASQGGQVVGGYTVIILGELGGYVEICSSNSPLAAPVLLTSTLLVGFRSVASQCCSGDCSAGRPSTACQLAISTTFVAGAMMAVADRLLR